MIQCNDIVYLPVKDGYIKYKVRRVVDDTVIVRGNDHNWLSISDVLTEEQFNKQYKGEPIYG